MKKETKTERILFALSKTSGIDFGIGVAASLLALTFAYHGISNWNRERKAEARAEVNRLENIGYLEKDLNTWLQQEGDNKYSEASRWFSKHWYVPPELDPDKKTVFRVRSSLSYGPVVIDRSNEIEILLDESWAENLVNGMRDFYNNPYVDTGPGFP